MDLWFYMAVYDFPRAICSDIVLSGRLGFVKTKSAPIGPVVDPHVARRTTYGARTSGPRTRINNHSMETVTMVDAVRGDTARRGGKRTRAHSGAVVPFRARCHRRERPRKPQAVARRSAPHRRAAPRSHHMAPPAESLVSSPDSSAPNRCTSSAHGSPWSPEQSRHIVSPWREAS